MKTVRHNIFETNSSSTHSMCIVTKEEELKISSGEMFLRSMYDTTVISKEERDELLQKELEKYNSYHNTNISLAELINSDYYGDNRSEFPCNLDEWLEYGELEYNGNSYTTKAGEVINIYCKYGYDS